MRFPETEGEMWRLGYCAIAIMWVALLVKIIYDNHI